MRDHTPPFRGKLLGFSLVLRSLLYSLNRHQIGRTYGEKDPLYDEAVQVVLTEKRASISLVQRHLAIGYNRAANILEAMEAAGLVSKPNAMGKRTTLVPDREL